jgi:hypothetical protein
VAIYTSAKALSRWPINDESTLTSSRKTNKRKTYVKNIYRAVERYIQAEGRILHLTSNRIKSIKDIELMDLYLIITECLSLKNINLQKSILFYCLKHIF